MFLAGAGGRHEASEEIQAAVRSALQVLQDGGFVESFAITWGSTPNLPGPGESLPLRNEALGGDVFQVHGFSCVCLWKDLLVGLRVFKALLRISTPSPYHFEY